MNWTSLLRKGTTVSPVAPASYSAAATKPRGAVALVLLLTVWGTGAYFWQSRDWNNASRLMLTYALVDRGTLYIDGLQMHAGDMQLRIGDLAVHGGHFYTEKAPGQSLLGVPVYAIWKWIAGYEGHPLDHEAREYWPQDYWVTLFTSGLASALAVVLVYCASVRLRAGQRFSVLLALAYGLGTHALVYSTLFYGHQTAALCLLGAFLLVLGGGGNPAQQSRCALWRWASAGLIAGFGVMIEMPLLPAVMFLGLEVLRRKRRVKPAAIFALGVCASMSVLLWYHWAAFGDPFTTGYHHVWDQTVRRVHQGVGLFGPNWSVLPELLWGSRRGLFVYAPVTLLGVAAMAVMGWRRRWELCIVPGATLLSLLVVNVSHFYWAGGFSTGPRFLLPAVPLVMLPLAGWLGMHKGRYGGGMLRGGVAVLAGIGGVIALSCTLTGGRFGPVNDYKTGVVPAKNPLVAAVYPALMNLRLTRTAAGQLLGASPGLQIAGIVVFLLIMGTLLVLCSREERGKLARGGG